MTASLTIIKYPGWAVPFAFLSMAFFRVPLWLDNSIRFWVLMGSGQKSGFDWRPNLRQWAVLTVSVPGNAAQDHASADHHTRHPSPATVSRFINYWLKLFHCNTITYQLMPLEGHGLWNGKQVFGPLPKHSDHTGQIAVLTRATIRLSRLYRFWKNVPPVVSHLPDAKGLLRSYGIGEIPFVKQATFSLWESRAAMQAFAYQFSGHKNVIKKTRAENWYNEEMFVRFRVLKISET